MSSTLPADPASALQSQSIPATAAELEVAIARAQAQLADLQRKKEEAANQYLKVREETLDQTAKALKLEPSRLATALRILEEAKKAFGVSDDAQLIGHLNLLADARQKLGATANQDLIVMIRNRSIASSKAKRLPEDTLKLMQAVLKEGAKVPEVARYFKVSLATVNSRKAEWRLTKRPNVKLISLSEALERVKKRAK